MNRMFFRKVGLEFCRGAIAGAILLLIENQSTAFEALKVRDYATLESLAVVVAVGALAAGVRGLQALFTTLEPQKEQ